MNELTINELQTKLKVNRRKWMPKLQEAFANPSVIKVDLYIVYSQHEYTKMSPLVHRIDGDEVATVSRDITPTHYWGLEIVLIVHDRDRGQYTVPTNCTSWWEMGIDGTPIYSVEEIDDAFQTATQACIKDVLAIRQQEIAVRIAETMQYPNVIASSDFRHRLEAIANSVVGDIQKVVEETMTVDEVDDAYFSGIGF